MFLEGRAVPDEAVCLYRMVWQLEKWLRAMVYVELRSRDSKWEDAIKNHTTKWPPSSIQSDKKLRHMATAHQSVVSYLSLGQLWDVIVDGDNWRLFAPYFPPLDITVARMQEVRNIRNRIMHFRGPNENDVSRMGLFLKDFEPGIRLFCQSYTTGIVGAEQVEQDALGKILSERWNSIGHRVELNALDIGWLYAPEPYRGNPKIGASLCSLRRPWADEHDECHLYRLTLSSLDSGREIDFEKMLEASESVHEKCLHVFIESFEHCEFGAIIPEHVGAEENAETIAAFLRAGINWAIGRSISETEAIGISRRMPEYVLWPDNALVSYGENFSGSLIDLGELDSES